MSHEVVELLSACRTITLKQFKLGFILKPVCFDRMAVTAGASNMKRPEIGYENMSHFVVDTDDLADTLRNIQFCSGMQV